MQKTDNSNWTSQSLYKQVDAKPYLNRQSLVWNKSNQGTQFSTNYAFCRGEMIMNAQKHVILEHG